MPDRELRTVLKTISTRPMVAKWLDGSKAAPDREIGIGIVRVADEAADLMTDRVPG